MSCLIRFIFIGSCYCIRRTCNVYYKILLLVKLFLLNIPHGKIQTGEVIPKSVQSVNLRYTLVTM